MNREIVDVKEGEVKPLFSKSCIEVFFVFLSIVLVFTLSVYKRYEQFQVWKSHPHEYFVKNLPLMSTVDAYHWLRYAQDKIRGIVRKKDLRGFPHREIYPQDIPLFSKLLVYTYKFFPSEGYDPLYTGSIKFCIFLSSLFIIPFIIYIYLAGEGLAGFLGALITTFGVSYYRRTSVGRVDTDGIVMLLPFLISLIFLIAIKTNRIYLKYILIGIVAFILYYLRGIHSSVTMLPVVFSIILIIALFLHKIEKKHIVGLMVTFIICSNPIYIYKNIDRLPTVLKTNRYLRDKHLLEDISESKRVDLNTVVDFNIKNKELFYIGLGSVILLFLLNFKNMIFLFPFFIIGTMTFFFSLRFNIFLTPFIGIGLGYITWRTIKFIFFDFYTKKMINNILLKYICSFVILTIVFFSIRNYTGFKYIPKPAIDANVARAILELKNKLPENSVMFTWRDLGTSLEALGNFITVADTTQVSSFNLSFLATSFFIKDTDSFYRFVSYISNKGLAKFGKIVREKNNRQFNYILNNYNKPIPKKYNIYIFYTYDMIFKMYTISKYAFFTAAKDKKNMYGVMHCYNYKNNMLFCDVGNIDLKKGIFMDKQTLQEVPICKVNVINNGKEVKKQIYNKTSDYNISILMKGKYVYQVLFYTNAMGNTVFHKQYIEGKKGDKFIEIYKDLPFVRVFKFKN